CAGFRAHSAFHGPNMDTPTSRLNFRRSGNIIQLDIAAASFRLDLAIALGYLDGPAGGLQHHYLGPPDVQVSAARFRRDMACGRKQPNASAAGLSFNVIPHFADIDVAAAA